MFMFQCSKLVHALMCDTLHLGCVLSVAVPLNVERLGDWQWFASACWFQIVILIGENLKKIFLLWYCTNFFI